MSYYDPYPTHSYPWFGPAGDPPAHPPRVSPEMLIAQLEARIVVLELVIRRLERMTSFAHSHVTYGELTKPPV